MGGLQKREFDNILDISSNNHWMVVWKENGEHPWQ